MENKLGKRPAAAPQPSNPVKKQKLTAPSQNARLQVMIDGELYTLNKIPEENSEIVKSATQRFLRTIDLKSFAADIGHVGSLIRIARNGVSAAGHTEQEEDIQKLEHEIVNLCDKSTMTVSSFEKASTNVLTDLQATYQYLLDNLEELALFTLSAVSNLAKQMEEAALALHKNFERKKEMVVEALERAQLRGEEIKIKREMIQLKWKEQEQLIKDFQRKEDEFAARRRNFEDQVDALIEDLDFPDSGTTMKRICNGLTSTFFYGVRVFDDKDDREKKLQALQQCRRETLEKEEEIQKQRHEALRRMTNEFATVTRIEDCSSENMAEVVCKALHGAVGALRNVSDIMMQAAYFWEKMRNSCQDLAVKDMKGQVTIAMEFEEDKRLKVWTSDGFKTKAVRFCADWVALKGLCTKYLGHLKETQYELHHYVRENPTVDECRENVKKFLSDLQAELKERETETQREIDMQS